MTLRYSWIAVMLFSLTISACGGGGGKNLSIASFGGNVGSGCTSTDPNQGCAPPGGSDTSSASAVITDTNYQIIANRVAYDLDSVLRQRAGLPPTLIDTVASLMQRVVQASAPVCTNDTSSPVSVSPTTANSYTVTITDCQMQGDQVYPLSGTITVSNYTSTGTSPWVGSADLAINLTYAVSIDQNLNFDGNMSFTTQFDSTTQVLTTTVIPDNLRVVIETNGGSATATTSVFDTFTSGTLSNATDQTTLQQTLTVTAGYYNGSITQTQLDIPTSFLVWLDGFDNPDAGASGTLQVTDSNGGSTLVMAPVDATRMDLTLNGATTVCIGWTELTPPGCSP